MPNTNGQQDLETILRLLSVSPADFAIYSKAVSFPPLPVTLFAKRLEITRQNAYNILERLNQNGLLLNFRENTGRYVQVVPPKQLELLLQEKIKNLQSSKDSTIKKVITELEKNTHARPVHRAKVSYFEGLTGVRTLYNQSLLTQEKILRTLSCENIFERLGTDFTIQYIEERKRRGIINKVLQNKPSKKFSAIYTNNKKQNRYYKIPPKSIVLDSVIVIYDNSVLLITLKDDLLFGTHIDSIDYSNTMKSWFDTIYQISTPFEG